MDKRQRKIDGFDYSSHWAEIDGDGELAVLTWGRPANPLREAVNCARAQASGVN